MSNYPHVIQLLQQLSPLEILEMCKLDDDPEGLIEALADWIEDNLEDVEAELTSNHFMEESDE